MVKHGQLKRSESYAKTYREKAKGHWVCRGRCLCSRNGPLGVAFSAGRTHVLAVFALVMGPGLLSWLWTSIQFWEWVCRGQFPCEHYFQDPGVVLSSSAQSWDSERSHHKNVHWKTNQASVYSSIKQLIIPPSRGFLNES